MKKQQKYRKTRKELTKCEALSSIANAKISIQNSQEFIDTCKSGYINGICLLVAINDFGSIENAIDAEYNKIQWYNDKINDLKRFL